MVHLRVWKFRPPAQRGQEFEVAYSPEGLWSRLFATAAGYRGTDLLRPSQPGGWWMTIDRWESEAAFLAFQAARGDAYRALDHHLEGVAGDEEFVGAFEG